MLASFSLLWREQDVTFFLLGQSPLWMIYGVNFFQWFFTPSFFSNLFLNPKLNNNDKSITFLIIKLDNAVS